MKTRKGNQGKGTGKGKGCWVPLVGPGSRLTTNLKEDFPEGLTGNFWVILRKLLGKRLATQGFNRFLQVDLPVKWVGPFKQVQLYRGVREELWGFRRPSN